MDISTNRPANANPALLPLEARRRYQAISDAQKAVTRYKSTRTRYANRPSAENCYHLNRAENTLVSAVRNAASGLVETPKAADALDQLLSEAAKRKATTERVTAALVELHDLQGAQ